MNDGRQGKIRWPVALMLAVCMSAAVFLGYVGGKGYLEQRAGTSYYAALATQAHAASLPADGAQETSPLPSARPGPSASAGLSAAPDGTDRPQARSTTARPEPSPTVAAMSAAGISAEPEASVGEASVPSKARPAAPVFAEKEKKAEDEETGEPEVEEQAPLSALDFDALRLTGPDIVGWVSIEGTVINYPVVQGEDNRFYLSHLPDGTPNSAGSIMMDVANTDLFTDDVTILHGHHMRSGAMFGDLEEYEREAYYLEHPMMRLYTPRGDYDVAIFAAYSVDGSTFAYPTAFSGQEGFDEFIARARSRTPYQTDVEVAYGDHLLMLSTCAYAYEYERFLVVGKILDQPEGEAGAP